MGGIAGASVSLVEATTYRLRYLAVISSDILGPIVIPNYLGGATPNLDTDSLGVSPSSRPMVEQVRTPVANQAQARHLMNGHSSAGAPTLANIRRAHVKITPRTGPATHWDVDVNEGVAGGSALSAGRAVVTVAATGGLVNGDSAYIDIHIAHSLPR